MITFPSPSGFTDRSRMGTLCPSCGDALVALFDDPLRPAVKKHAFTPREIEAAHLIQEGLTYDEMADRMGISTRTVIAYANSLRLHLGVDKKRRVPAAMRELGLLD